MGSALLDADILLFDSHSVWSYFGPIPDSAIEIVLISRQALIELSSFFWRSKLCRTRCLIHPFANTRPQPAGHGFQT